MALLRLLLIVLVIYLGFRFVLKPLLRILLQYMVKKVVDNTMEDFKRQGNRAAQPKRPEGTIFVDYVPDGKSKSKPPKDKDEGEFVDYEEVK
jgi:hypothetical protein